MIPLPFPLPSQLFPAILQAISELAKHAGGEELKKRLQRFLHANTFEREVNAAIERAYRHFQQTFPDRELLDLLSLDQQLSANKNVTRLLAEAAASPLYQAEQTRRLSREISHVARHVAIERCEAAAKSLIESLHAELAQVRDLQTALMMLSNQQLAQALEDSRRLPPFAPGLHEAVMAAALRVATELGQGYVTSAHLVYGLVMLKSSTASHVLLQFDVTEAKTRAALERIIGQYDGIVEDPLTHKAETTFETAQRLAQRRLAMTTRSEHLLLALLEAADGGPGSSASLTRLFEAVGISPGRVRDHLLKSIRIESAVRTFAQISGLPPEEQ